MNKLIRVHSFALLVILVIPIFAGNSIIHPTEIRSNSRLVYDQLKNNSLSYEAFNLALKGYMELKDSLNLRDNVFTVVDFSKPSTEKRFHLIDIESKEVLYEDYVAHGKNTGLLEAKSFSNKVNSFQSSLGFFKTAETYYGKNGLSLKLDGLEKGINHLARKRAIVIHAADYAEEEFIIKYGRLGRSFGCPALPTENFNEIIDVIKDGTLLFIYYPEETYLENSKILN